MMPRSIMELVCNNRCGIDSLGLTTHLPQACRASFLALNLTLAFQLVSYGTLLAIIAHLAHRALFWPPTWPTFGHHASHQAYRALFWPSHGRLLAIIPPSRSTGHSFGPSMAPFWPSCLWQAYRALFWPITPTPQPYRLQ